jgi:hypothetical protein
MDMNIKTWMMVLAAAAVMAAVSGCQDPVSGSNRPEADGAPKDGKPKDSPVAGVPAADDFTVSLVVGSGGPSAGGSPLLSSRSVAGPDAGGIQYGSILNTVQVIAVKADTGKVTNFHQFLRPNDANNGATFTLKDLLHGSRYHFLVLMGHRERDYATEAPGGDYAYTDDPPTLLAAGLLADREIREEAGEIINITMKPLVVDTVFKQAGTVVEAALPAAQSGGARLSSLADTSLVWTLTRGFEELLAAQDKVAEAAEGIGIGWGVPYQDQDVLTGSVKKTLLRIDGGAVQKAGAALSGADDNQIVLNLGAPAEGTAGSANFTIDYAPFGVSNMDAFTAIDPDALRWIIRNGVNDEPQNAGTVFPSPSAAANSPWTGTTADKPNGNGAVVFTFPVTGYSGPFSGDRQDNKDSVIDLIRGAAGKDQLTLGLDQRTEELVSLSAVTDLGAEGLVLNSSNSPRAVTIDGQGRTVRLVGGSGAVITVGSEVTLTLRNITFAGKTGNSAPLVQVQNGGKLVLETGAVIRDNVNAGGSGGGVYVYAGGSFEMSGGAISNNETTNDGGGLYATGTGGTIRMTGGTISGNRVPYEHGGGGVAIYGGRSFEMSGDAAISGNTGESRGGGVYIYQGSFEMSGNAAISGNKAPGDNRALKGFGGGVFVEKGTFTMKGSAEVSGNTTRYDGGGVHLNGNSTLDIKESAKIRNNTTTSGYGGGIGTDESKIMMSGAAEISGNKAHIGGGVEVYNSEFVMEGGTISGNTATIYYGGGVLVEDGSLKMTGIAAISGNTAVDNGGGVYVESGSFEMTGNAAISGNTGKIGGGVYVNTASSFAMSGGYIYGSSAGTLANNAVQTNSAAVYADPGAASPVATTNKTVKAGVIQP